MIKRRAALLSALALSGCGFEPVYSAKGKGEAPAADMAAVEVAPMFERPGQILRDTLVARLNSDNATPRRFDLKVSFWITGEAQAVLNFSQPTRVRLVGYGNWVLTARDAKQTKLAEGSDKVMDGYDVFDTQLFANDLDNEHVSRRIAEVMASRIADRLAIWFHAHPTAVG
jgi:LPS-assembly lipoprotein